MHDFDQLVQLNVGIGDAETAGDQESLEAVLAPALAFRRANGAVVDRPTFLRDVTRGPRRETHIDSISLLGNSRAIVTCVVSMEVEGQDKSFHNVRLFVRSEEGGWRLLGWANEPA